MTAVCEAVERDRRSTQSVERACALLHCLAAHPRDLTLTDLARQLGVHKSTVARLLAPLEAAGLVQRDDLTGRYHLGLGIVAMSGGVLGRIAVLRIADPQLRRLAELTQQTVNLGIRYRDDILNIEQIPGPNLVRSVGWLGRRAPLHLGSGAKALLAHLSDAEVEDYLQSAVCRGVHLDPARVWEAIREIRQRGYAINRGELNPEIYAVGAPIFDAEGRSSAAVSVAGLRQEFTETRMLELARLVVRTAQTISRQLGFSPGRLTQLA